MANFTDIIKKLKKDSPLIKIQKKADEKSEELKELYRGITLDRKGKRHVGKMRKEYEAEHSKLRNDYQHQLEEIGISYMEQEIEYLNNNYKSNGEENNKESDQESDKKSGEEKGS